MQKKTTTTKIYADLLVDFLHEKGIRHVFDLTGGMIAYIEDSIRKKKGIECVPMHHEQAAGFAAEGYSRVSKNFGVAIATSGPGATNLITAIGSCYFDSVPAMFIVGQVHTNSIKKNKHVRQEGFQETDIVTIISPVTKYAVLVTDPEMVIYELEKAHYIMKSGRPGPVLIDIPINIQRTKVSKKPCKHFYGSKEHVRLEAKSKKKSSLMVSKLEKMLTHSKAPLVLVGHGVRLSDTVKDFSAFVRKNNLPYVSSLMGIDVCDHADAHNYVGYIGTNGNRDANIILASADLLIVLGSRLDVRQIGDSKFFNQSTRIVHVDIDEHVIDYSLKSVLSFNTSLRDFFDQTKVLSTRAKPKWVSFIKDIKKRHERTLSLVDDHVDPNYFLHLVSLMASPHSVISVDVGQNQMWTAQSWKVKSGQRILFSGGMGAMGFSLPASIGSWFSNKKLNPIAICGDGGLQINIQELETVKRNAIPLKLLVLNNQSLGMVREFQDLYFNKHYQSTVIGYGCPDFSKLAVAYGFKYVRIDSLRDGFDEKMKGVLESSEPVFVDVIIPENSSLHPRVVFGKALDDQAPYLSDEQKIEIQKLRTDLFL